MSYDSANLTTPGMREGSVRRVWEGDRVRSVIKRVRCDSAEYMGRVISYAPQPLISPSLPLRHHNPSPPPPPTHTDIKWLGVHVDKLTASLPNSAPPTQPPFPPLPLHRQQTPPPPPPPPPPQTHAQTQTDIKWLGVRPSDLDRFNIPQQCRLPMTEEDVRTGKKLVSLLVCVCVAGCAPISPRLDVFVCNKMVLLLSRTCLHARDRCLCTC